MYKIEVVKYRSEEMQVVSGAIGKERVHYEAVPAKDVKVEMNKFLLWLNTEESMQNVLLKAEFWEKHKATPINERQRLMINKLFDDFFGKLTSSKWVKITKTSSDTALRDIKDLIEKGVLQQEKGGGRSANYTLRE